MKMSAHVVGRFALLVATVECIALAQADKHVPMSEPIFNETVTDIDGFDHDVEFELNALHLRARHGGAFIDETSFEIEWLVTHHLGFRLEPAFGTFVDGSSNRKWVVGGTAGASWKLIQDFRRDFYLQTELAARTSLGAEAIVAPGDSPLPSR